MTTVRRAGTASAAALSGLVLTLGLAHAAAPEWVRQAGLDVWNAPALRDSLRAGNHRRAELLAHEERLFREIETIDHLAARLAAGSLSLAGATDAAEPILRERPSFPYTASQYYPAPTFRQSIARYLIARIERRHADPARWATISARLEAEYAALR
jgi:hypothetical protein